MLSLLLNQLPPKEKDPRSFILPCSIGRLDFNNALADLGASISIMPFSMYKRLGIGNLEIIKMNIELADNSKCILKGIVRNLLETYEEIAYKCCLTAQEAIRENTKPILGTSDDEDDIEGIIVYLEPTSCEGFIDLDDVGFWGCRT
ncbi:hypothetical protein Tco_0442660 [Tanacetum coccineum]